MAVLWHVSPWQTRVTGLRACHPALPVSTCMRLLLPGSSWERPGDPLVLHMVTCAWGVRRKPGGGCSPGPLLPGQPRGTGPIPGLGIQKYSHMHASFAGIQRESGAGGRSSPCPEGVTVWRELCLQRRGPSPTPARPEPEGLGSRAQAGPRGAHSHKGRAGGTWGAAQGSLRRPVHLPSLPPVGCRRLGQAPPVSSGSKE